MGLRGPRPTPPEIMAMRGSHHKQNPDYPKSADSLPEASDWLDEAGKEVYAEVVRQLESMGIGRAPDVRAVERYARLWVRWRQADQFIRQFGETYPLKNKSDKIVGFKAFPQVAIVKDLSEALLRLERDFGLTPSARARITIEVPPSAGETPRFKSKIVG